MSRLLVLLLLLVNCAVALKLPARSTPRYEALVGGRPTTAAPLGTPQDIARLIKNSVVDVHQAARAIKAELIVTPSAATRVWLDLNMNQSLLLSFEQTRDDTPSTCTMRVKQTRLADECTLDGTSSESSTCADVGCVAVRWNLATRQGILIDLFKNTKGERIGCDLSSADDPNVPWGQLMLRVVDDIACLLQMQHVFLADEATVPLRVWDAHADSSGGLRAAPMKLQYLHPLVHGIGYYEQHGYYRVPRGEYYGRAHHSGDRTAANGDARDLEMAWRRARSEVEAFRTLRIAPFVDGCFAHAIGALARDAAVQPGASRILRFARAIGDAQREGTQTLQLAALRAAAHRVDAETTAAVETDGTAAAHPRCGSLVAFIEQHAAALDDADVLRAPHLSAMTRRLRTRAWRAERAYADAEEEELALRAAALLRELLFDVFAVWRREREGPPLMRKDYSYEADGTTRCSTFVCAAGADAGAGGTASDGSGGGSVVGVDGEMELCWRRHAPIIKAAYFVCEEAEDGAACALPWAPDRSEVLVKSEDQDA